MFCSICFSRKFGCRLRQCYSTHGYKWKRKENIPGEGCIVDIISLISGNHIYIGETSINRTVRAVDDNGRELWKYEHPELRFPMRLTKDNMENIYIAGFCSHNIHLISSAGYALKIFEQIVYPCRMIIRKESNNEFYVVSALKSIKQVKLIWWIMYLTRIELQNWYLSYMLLQV